MLQEQYRIFLSEIYEKNKNGDHLSPSSVNHYAVESIRKINEVLRQLYPTFTSLYDVESIEELTGLKKIFLLKILFRIPEKSNNYSFTKMKVCVLVPNWIFAISKSLGIMS